MFRIIRNMFLMRRRPPKHDTPVAPLGLWGVGPRFSIHLSPRWGLCRKTQLKHDTTSNLRDSMKLLPDFQDSFFIHFINKLKGTTNYESYTTATTASIKP